MYFCTLGVARGCTTCCGCAGEDVGPRPSPGMTSAGPGMTPTTPGAPATPGMTPAPVSSPCLARGPTSFCGCAGEEAVRTLAPGGASAVVFHLMPVGKPAPPRPRNPDAST